MFANEGYNTAYFGIRQQVNERRRASYDGDTSSHIELLGLAMLSHETSAFSATRTTAYLTSAECIDKSV